MNDRTSRVEESRGPEHETRDDIWEPTGLLSLRGVDLDPNFHYRFVRTHVHGDDDSSNVMRKMNERYVPVPAEELKGSFLPAIKHNGKNVIGHHGCILMKRRMEDHLAHQRHHRELIAAQMRSQKENLFRVHNPHDVGFGAPTMSVQSRVQRGQAAIMDD